MVAVPQNFLTGKPLFNYLPIDGRRLLRETFNELQSLSGSHNFEFRIKPRLGDIVDVLAHVDIVRDGADDPSLRWLLRDITAYKRAEHEFQQLNTRFEERVVERTRVLDAANRAKDRFLAILSHELRTPLAAMLGAIDELAAEVPADSPSAAIVEIVRRSAELEARLIDDLLDLTKITKGKLTLNMEHVDAHRILLHAIEICREQIEQAGPSLALHLDAEHHTVHADPARLEQVFWNIIKNAVKFTPAGGSITIRTWRAEEGDLRVEITDTGIGIEPDRIAEIFTAFEQGGEWITSRYGGLGLGLSISKALVEMQGGVISVVSEGPSKGASFTVSLPTVQEEEGRPDRQETPGDQKPAGQGRRILLVEDHVDTNRVMTLLLRRRGYEVTPTSTVQDALEVAGREHFDLVISDIGLPDGTGLDLIHALQAIGPVTGIALSGYGMDDDIRRSHEAGFAEHLTKPVSSTRLLAVIERLVG